MPDHHDRPVPPSATELATTDDDTAEELIFAYVDECLRQSPADQFGAFKSLPRGMQYVYSTILLEGEVENGGFNQYFFNIASDYALEALDGYKRIGAVDHATLVRQAIAVYHRERWFHFRIRLRRSLESFFESYKHTRLSEVDAIFFELDEDPTALRGRYIRDHLEEFAVSG
jgi:hypothetical protein